MSGADGFLSGLRVLELGDGVAGASASGLLSAMGADVTTVTHSSSPHRSGRPVVTADAGGASLLSVVLDRGKHRIDADGMGLVDLEELLAASTGTVFDLVVFDRVAPPRGVLAALGDFDTYSDWVQCVNSTAWVTISAFGLSGPRRGDFGTELTLAAAGGILAVVHDAGSGTPMKLAGYQSLLNTGQAAALAACHALDLRADGTAVHIDLSALEATIAMGPALAIAMSLLDTGTAGGSKRYGAPASFYPCRDGMVRISAMEDHQWQGVVAAMGSPTWAARFATMQARIDDPDEIDRRIAEWTRTIDKTEAETILQAEGVPATAMQSPAEALRSPQLLHRGAFEALPLPDGREATIIGTPYRSVDARAAHAAPPRRRMLRGLKVLELSHVLAAPLCGALLGALGAQVTKLEDLQRIDMYRRRGPYVDGVASGERSAYFAIVNHSKRSEAFDIEAHPERLRALLESADVVVENLGGRRAIRLGVASSELAKHHPEALGVSSSGFGQTGPFASYRAYANNVQASCCLGYLTRSQHGEPAAIDVPWADLITVYALATVVAAWAVGPRGNTGAGLDIAMADLVMSRFNEFVAAASLDPASDSHVDRANESSPLAPNGVYPTSDGWIAISVDGERQYASLAQTLGHVELLRARYATSETRFQHRHELDVVVAEATRAWTAATLAARLRGGGVAAEEAGRLPDFENDEQLRERHFFTAVEHPEWGVRRLVGVPWRPIGRPAIPLGAPPLLRPLDDASG